MEVVRNIQIKLDVSPEGAEALDETFEQFRHAAQHVADHGWDDNPYNITDTRNTLHKETYSDVREKLSLQSSLVQSARTLAADALSNCKDRKFDGGTHQQTRVPWKRGRVQRSNHGLIRYRREPVPVPD